MATLRGVKTQLNETETRVQKNCEDEYLKEVEIRRLSKNVRSLMSEATELQLLEEKVSKKEFEESAEGTSTPSVSGHLGNAARRKDAAQRD